MIQYVQDIRDAELALSIKDEKINDGEKMTARRARRALYASRDIQNGEIVKDEDILIVRPQGPMSADQYDQIVGLPIKKAIMKHDPFKENYF